VGKASRSRHWCLLAALCTAASAEAQPTGRVTGSVRDTTGGTLANVELRLVGPVDREAVSGADGSFEFSGLPDGEYRLHAALPGFAPADQTLHVEPGRPLAVSLRLWVLAFDKVVVTAEKSGERDAQAAPIAISVLAGAELLRSGVKSVEGVAGLAPAVTFSQNTGFAQLTIRGIGTNAIFTGTDPSSAVYVDGVYLARPAAVLADFLDVERVEVLRGPQGTLYGRNAVGGALNVLTRAPSDTLRAEARVEVGSLDELRAEATASGPLVKDRLSGSVSLLRGVRDGFVRDLDHPDHPLGGDDVTAARGKLRLALGERGDLVVAGDATLEDPTPLTYAKVLAVKPGFEVDNPPGFREVRTSTLADSRNRQYGVSARLTLPLSSAITLTSLTAYRNLDYDVLVDTDITELALAATHVHELQHQWSEELTVSGQGGRLGWVGGVYLLQDADRQPTSVLLPTAGVENELELAVDTSTGAAFGQATLAVTHGLSAVAGLRYTHERKSIDSSGRTAPLDQASLPLAGTPYAYTDALSDDAWTPRFALELSAGAQGLAYVSATRGFKSGGWNATSRASGEGYAPEWAWSYEAGFKRTLLGGRARLNLAAFHTDYEDLQVQTTIRPGFQEITNAAAARINGVELEGVLRPAGQLQLGGHAAWLDTRYDRYVAVGVGGVTGDVSGNRLSNAPEWSGRLWLEWSAGLGRLGLLSLRAESRFQSTVYFTPFNDDVQRQGGYGLFDASVELGPAHWSLTAYARNLAGRDYITGSFGSPPPAIGGRPGEPREWGLRFAVRR
jgi:iron complex outermembrane recepter protein